MPTLPAELRPVTDVPAASPDRARAHFESLLEFETDCWDVNAALAAGHPGFVVLDVRSPQLYAAGHVPGAEPGRLPGRHPVRRLLLGAALQRRRPRGGAAGPAGPAGEEDDRRHHRLA
jgi:hypothetical protein